MRDSIILTIRSMGPRISVRIEVVSVILRIQITHSTEHTVKRLHDRT